MNSNILKQILIIFTLIILCESDCLSSNEKKLSFSANAHIFMLKLLGKYKIFEKEEENIIQNVETYPRHYLPKRTTKSKLSKYKTVSTTTSATTETPYVVGIQSLEIQPDGKTKLVPVPLEEPLQYAIKQLIQHGYAQELSKGYIKIYITSTIPPQE